MTFDESERDIMKRVNDYLVHRYGKENLKRYFINRSNGMSEKEAERDADLAYPPLWASGRANG